MSYNPNTPNDQFMVFTPTDPFRAFTNNNNGAPKSNVPDRGSKKRKLDEAYESPLPDIFTPDSNGMLSSWLTPMPVNSPISDQMTEEEVLKLFEFEPGVNRTTSMSSFTDYMSTLPDPEPVGLSRSAQRLMEIMDFIDKINTEMEQVYWDQKNLIVPAPKHDFDRINATQINLLQSAKRIQEDLKAILNEELLNPSQLYQHSNLQQETNTIFTKLQLYQEELMFISSSEAIHSTRCYACLIINKQPFPKSVKQHTKSTSVLGEDPTIVQLLKAPKGDCKPISQVKAGLVYEDYQSKRGSFTITNDKQEMDDCGIARFTDLRFPQGTRLKMVRLQFAVEVQFAQFNGTACKALLETKEPSNPFIVMTNENQWESSEGILLKKDVFEGNIEVPWFMFANTLQVHYLRSTRQEPSEPKRPLSKFDFEYIKKNMFENRDSISQKDFDKFWSWFGKVMHKIRHQKPFLYLWLQGLVYGFISKPDVEFLLKDQPIGTFIIRFSERRPGKVAIAYNKYDEAIKRVETKHYLVDLHDAKDSKTLPDFLRDNGLFTQLLKLKTSYSCTPESFIEGRVQKDVVMKEYYTKTTADIVDGYEEDLYQN